MGAGAEEGEEEEDRELDHGRFGCGVVGGCWWFFPLHGRFHGKDKWILDGTFFSPIPRN